MQQRITPTKKITPTESRGLLDDGGLEEPCSVQVKVSNNAVSLLTAFDYSYWSNGLIMGTVG